MILMFILYMVIFRALIFDFHPEVSVVFVVKTVFEKEFEMSTYFAVKVSSVLVDVCK